MREKEMFRIIQDDENQVILKVKKLSNLEIARNPFVNSTYDYINLTKGEDHILTVVLKDGDTFSFHFGIRGYTLISDNLSRLKKEVLKFLENKKISIN